MNGLGFLEMSYNFEATDDFFESVKEIDSLIDFAQREPDYQNLFLKQATTSLVTKFQVYVETVLKEFRFSLNGKKSSSIPIYMRLNSIRLSMPNSALNKLEKHRNYNDECKEKVKQAIEDMSYLKDESEIDNTLQMEQKFPLGRTGKDELFKLLQQIKGESKPFAAFETDTLTMDKLDSILQMRHNVIHQDRFNSTERDVVDNENFIKKIVEYIDGYLVI